MVAAPRESDGFGVAASRGDWRLRAAFGGEAIIIFAPVTQVHVNAMSTSVRHFVPVYDDE